MGSYEMREVGGSGEETKGRDQNELGFLSGFLDEGGGGSYGYK